MNSTDTILSEMVATLSELNPRKMDLSQSCKAALKRTLNAVEYYLEIYRNILEQILETCGKSPDETTIVDFGGGHGILSILAKKLGFYRVIYVDYNPDSLKMASMIGNQLGTMPDAMLQGDATTLKTWCAENSVIPDGLLAMDVIEHIYVLDDFFACLHEISPRMKMIFTTASSPYNHRVVRKLHKAMIADEMGTAIKKGFWHMRRDYIQKSYPDMSDRELDFWADNTRGLKYDDVLRAVDARSPNLLLDKYNTCDPRTGSWTERILPIDDYRELLSPYGFNVVVLPGRYNQYRRGPKAWYSRYYNKRIDKAPAHTAQRCRERRRMRKALKVAPFIFILVH